MMQSNLVMTANFATNRSLAAPAVYNGLYQRHQRVAFKSSGFITFKTDSKMKFSGKLYVEGEEGGLHGTFYLRRGWDDVSRGRPLTRKAVAVRPSTVVPTSGYGDGDDDGHH